MSARRTLEQSLALRTHKTDTCWLWIGRLDKYGYGLLGRRKDHELTIYKVHRVAFEIFVRPLLPDECVLHRCDVANCVNPQHLFTGTRTDNHRDMCAKGRHWKMKTTHCPQGHLYDAANTAMFRDGSRQCRTCRKARTWQRVILNRARRVRLRTQALSV